MTTETPIPPSPLPLDSAASLRDAQQSHEREISDLQRRIDARDRKVLDLLFYSSLAGTNEFSVSPQTLSDLFRKNFACLQTAAGDMRVACFDENGTELRSIDSDRLGRPEAFRAALRALVDRRDDAYSLLAKPSAVTAPGAADAQPPRPASPKDAARERLIAITKDRTLDSNKRVAAIRVLEEERVTAQREVSRRTRRDLEAEIASLTARAAKQVAERDAPAAIHTKNQIAKLRREMMEK